MENGEQLEFITEASSSNDFCPEFLNIKISVAKNVQ